MIFHHPDQPEFLAAQYLAGHDEMRALSQELGIPFVDLCPFYAKQIENLYRDGIHHNVQGQKVLANTLHNAVLAYLGAQTPPGAISR